MPVSNAAPEFPQPNLRTSDNQGRRMAIEMDNFIKEPGEEFHPFLSSSRSMGKSCTGRL